MIESSSKKKKPDTKRGVTPLIEVCDDSVKEHNLDLIDLNDDNLVSSRLSKHSQLPNKRQSSQQAFKSMKGKSSRDKSSKEPSKERS